MKNVYIVQGKEVDGWTPVQMCDGSGYTYVRSDGYIMPHRFAHASEFLNQMAMVELKDGPSDRRSTYITADEKVFGMRFSGVAPFDGEVGVAYIDDEEYFVDKDEHCFQFKNTIIDKLVPAKPDSKGLILEVKRNGKTYKRFATIFDVVGKASEGMLPIQMKDGSGQTFMDKNFNIMGHRFLEVGRFSSGFAPVLTFGGSIVYINKKGDVFTETQLTDAIDGFFEEMDNQVDEFKHYTHKPKYDEDGYGDDYDEDYEI
ncbi:MAG: hypothetical protein IJY90_02830 [Clostridia bacterium]|nr:hypothetical protein [Clostridia bacterium]